MYASKYFQIYQVQNGQLIYLANIAVYSNHPRAAAASSYLAIIFGRIASGVPWLLRSTAKPMQHRISAGADVGYGSLK